MFNQKTILDFYVLANPCFPRKRLNAEVGQLGDQWQLELTLPTDDGSAVFRGSSPEEVQQKALAECEFWEQYDPGLSYEDFVEYGIDPYEEE